jgi:sugar lactone lactonase YvrE
MIYDDRTCDLGEGPLWHPERGQLFWFDITAGRLMSRGADGPEEWVFPEMVSALGWVDRDRMVMAGESGLWALNLETGARTLLVDPGTGPAIRSNDGRADRQGGFWWSTMGKATEPGAAAFWRWHRGEVRCLFPGLTIPNAATFSPDGRTAYFADTLTHRVMQVALDAAGWPKGTPEVFLDLTAERLLPDGALVSADGTFWLALWGAGRVTGFAPDGTVVRQIDLPAPHATCPAFGGADGRTLFVTSARQGMSMQALAGCASAGMTFALADVAEGLPEPGVIL